MADGYPPLPPLDTESTRTAGEDEFHVLDRVVQPEGDGRKCLVLELLRFTDGRVQLRMSYYEFEGGQWLWRSRPPMAYTGDFESLLAQARAKGFFSPRQ